MIGNCDGRNFYIYTLINNATSICLTPTFYLVYGLEYVIACLGILYGLYFLFLVTKIKVFHRNIQHISCFNITAALTRNLGRLLIMSEEYIVYSEGVCTTKLHAGSFIVIWSNCVTIHILPSLLLERTLAYVLIEDYEKKNRLKIPIVILSTSFIIASALAYTVYRMWIETIYATFYGGTIIGLSFLGLCCLWFIHRKAYREHGAFDQSESYSLSRRFQLAENLRVFRLARNALVCLFCEGALVFGIQIAAAYYGVGGETVYIQSFMSILFPLVMTTCILSVEKWRNHLVSSLKLQRWTKKWTSRVAHHQFTQQELYFEQLNAAWIYTENLEECKK